ncbi:isochorismatase family protein [bacterium]|nr:isochorismatase family protein [bacterium]
MREKYFTTNNLQNESSRMVEEISHYPTKSRKFKLTKSALLLLDLQDYFLSANSHAFIPSAPEILENIVSLAEIFIKNRLPVIRTQHLNDTINAGMMADWWNDLLTLNHQYESLHSSIARLDCRTVVKSQYDAFYRTDLEEILIEHEVRQLVVCGVMTHLCCETTARSAFVRGFEVIFPVDGSATYTRDHHMATLRNLAHGFAAIPTIDEIMQMAKG